MTRSRIIEASDLEGRQERGYTTHSMPRSISGTLTSADTRSNILPGAPAGGPVSAAPELTEAIGNVMKFWPNEAFSGNPFHPPAALRTGSIFHIALSQA